MHQTRAATTAAIGLVCAKTAPLVVEGVVPPVTDLSVLVAGDGALVDLDDGDLDDGALDDGAFSVLGILVDGEDSVFGVISVSFCCCE